MRSAKGYALLSIAAFSFTAGTNIHAAPGSLSDVPLFLTTAVKPNIVLAIDDSGSMDSEVLMPTNDGALWWHTDDQNFVGRDKNDQPSAGQINYNQVGDSNSTWKKYVYLFPNGQGNASSGRRIYGDSNNDHFAIPPMPEFAFTRSPHYNAAYYDPKVTYNPWPSNGNAVYGPSDPTNASFDPVYNSTSLTLNLTSDQTSSSDNWTFKLQPGMRNASGNVVSSTTDETFTYFPATYYLKDQTLTSNYGDCSNLSPSTYENFKNNPNNLSGTADAIGPDGACLKRYEIKSSTSSYPGGRSYVEEIQNFANWFTYHRKRHQAMRGGIGSAFNGFSGIRTGMFTFNNRSTISMLDFDTQRTNFYDTLYSSVGSGGTPTRESLKHMGEQYKRTDANAPIIEACQQNFGIVFTDGFANVANTGVGNVDNAKGAPYEDSYSDTLADIAMKYYTENLRPSFSTGQVPVQRGCGAINPDPKLDCNANLHMNTFGVGLGAVGNIFGASHFTMDDAYTNHPVWQEPNQNRNPVQVDDMYHAAINGRGDMLNATTPAEIKDKMSKVLRNIANRAGSASSVSFNTTFLNSGSMAYQARFRSNFWSGELLAYQIDPYTGNISATPSWNAASELDAISPYNRTILTFDGSDGIPFQWGSLSTAQQNDLKTNSDGSISSDSIGQARLDYLRGSRIDEGQGNNFRIRSSVLGDIIYSTPIFVGAPDLTWPDSSDFGGIDSYSSFKNGPAKNRQKVIYVGANDGMLHGFDADTGAEILAYIPNNLFSTDSNAGLHYLTDPNYSHRYYVDQTPSVADTFIKTTPTGTPAWKTVLIGGQRGGGRGLFALDVTDPSIFSENSGAPADIVMWEFNSGHDVDLGFTFSKPTIALMENGQWAAVFGNGYNDLGSGQAQLFILFLEMGLDGTWSSGDYIKITTGIGDSGNRNGLSTPALADMNGDGRVDRVYAGDLFGNMWAFNLLGSNTSNWGVAYSQSNIPKPLFTALDSSNIAQPITVAPVLIKNPAVADSNNNQPNVLVLFGTGQYLVDADKTSTAQQTFYAVWDDGTTELDRSNLVAQTLLSGAPAHVRVPTDTAVNYEGNNNSKQSGWYFDLPDSGERIIVDAKIRGNLVFFNTMVPSSAPCSLGGYGWLMSMKLINGGPPDEPAFDLDQNGSIDSSDTVTINSTSHAPGGEKFNQGLPSESGLLSNYQFTQDSSGNINVRKIVGGGGQNTGRLSWREIRR